MHKSQIRNYALMHENRLSVFLVRYLETLANEGGRGPPTSIRASYKIKACTFFKRLFKRWQIKLPAYQIHDLHLKK